MYELSGFLADFARRFYISNKHSEKNRAPSARPILMAIQQLKFRILLLTAPQAKNLRNSRFLMQPPYKNITKTLKFSVRLPTTRFVYELGVYELSGFSIDLKTAKCTS